MKDSSSKALLVLAVILLIPGTSVKSPDGRLFCQVIAGICALPAVISGKKNKRIVGAIVLLAALGLALDTYSDHQTSLEKYRKSARPSAPGPQ